MEPQQYDRIADLLMQIRKKYADMLVTTDQTKQMRDDMLDMLNACLHTNDELGQLDAKGWL